MSKSLLKKTISPNYFLKKTIFLSKLLRKNCDKNTSGNYSEMVEKFYVKIKNIKQN